MEEEEEEEEGKKKGERTKSRPKKNQLPVYLLTIPHVSPKTGDRLNGVGSRQRSMTKG
jgi:hypothetical protein